MSQQVRSTVVGSWPKPEWLFNGLPSHSGNGEGCKSGFVEGVTEETRDRATKEAIDDQLNAGLMNVSDGEMRRGDLSDLCAAFVWRIVGCDGWPSVGRVGRLVWTIARLINDGL